MVQLITNPMTTSLQTERALSDLGVTDETLTDAEKASLDRDGFLAFPNLMSAALQALRGRVDELVVIEKENAGKEFSQEAGTNRLANLVDKGDAFRVCLTHPRVLAAISHVLCGDMKLSSLNSRDALPGQGLQGLHADWSGAVEPGDYQVCNSIWLLDDFTKDNGATRLVRGSHRSGKMPHDVMTDPKARHPEEEMLLAPAGTVVVFNSHTWHGGTLNRTSAPRRALHSYWSRRGQPQQQNQQKMLSASTKEAFSQALRHLLDLET
jgi:Phytanoyl-CoA dioxygenase (PhyH)